MDIQPQSSQEHNYDALAEARAKRLGKHVRQLENHLHSRWFDDTKTNKLLNRIREDVGQEVVGKKTHLLAVGYAYDPSGYIDPSPVLIDSDQAHFKDVTIHTLDGNDRVMFDYELNDTGDDASTWLYSIPPTAILCAEIDSSQSHKVYDYIANSRTLAAKMFQSTDFFNLNPEQQHMLLRKDVAEEMVADFGAEYDDETPVQISCHGYYQLQYSDTKPINWHDHLKQDGTLHGVIVHSVYLESLQDGLVHIASKQDFTYGQGLPCLVLANDEQETISFIPVVGITAFSSPNDM